MLSHVFHFCVLISWAHRIPCCISRRFKCCRSLFPFLDGNTLPLLRTLACEHRFRFS